MLAQPKRAALLAYIALEGFQAPECVVASGTSVGLAGEVFGEVVAQVLYTPDPSNPGDDGFRFRVVDSDTGSEPAVMTLTANQMPSVELPAGSTTIQAVKGGPTEFTITVEDADEDGLMAEVAIAPTGGAVELDLPSGPRLTEP